jgi:hypothetical protein
MVSFFRRWWWLLLPRLSKLAILSPLPHFNLKSLTSPINNPSVCKNITMNKSFANMPKSRTARRTQEEEANGADFLGKASSNDELYGL